MEDILLEIFLCLVIAFLLMVFHEGVKVLVYAINRRKNSSWRNFQTGNSQGGNIPKEKISGGNIPRERISRERIPWGNSPWKFWRYVDPIGLILAVTCYVPISKPYFFRIRDRRTNRLLGITGICSLLFVFVGGILVLRLQYGGMAGLNRLVPYVFWDRLPPAFWQYLTMLSFGMLVANLFPVSTFDMGLLVAGASSKAYLNIIKADGTIKIIFVLTLLLGIIRYGGVRLIVLLL